LKETYQRLKNKTSYFMSSFVKGIIGNADHCPSCAGNSAEILDRKAWVTQLRRCGSCSLIYRTPTSSSADNEVFYQNEYVEGFTTDCPSLEELKAWKESNFIDTEKSFAHYLRVLRELDARPGIKLLDYGCSWGYGSYQFSQAGYEVDSFEISRPRAAYAKQYLDVRIRSLSELKEGSYDIFFSSHVIEHVPNVSEMLELGMRMLRPGGWFVAFTPNGSSLFRQRAPRDWHLMWGQVHPQLIDEQFLRNFFPGRNMLLHSAPLCAFHQEEHINGVKEWIAHPSNQPVSLNHIELCFAIQK
jgi:SAM-dependent methyltransferase